MKRDDDYWDAHDALYPGGSTDSFEWKHLREVVLERDGRQCVECGETDPPLDVDHIVPLSQGGSNELSNLQTLCRDCHEDKHDRPIGRRGSREKSVWERVSDPDWEPPEVEDPILGWGSTETEESDERMDPEDFMGYLEEQLAQKMENDIERAKDHAGAEKWDEMTPKERDEYIASHGRYPGGSPDSDEWKWLQELVLERDGHECVECGSEGPTVDVHHVVPLSQGGTNELSNLATLCQSCYETQRTEFTVVNSATGQEIQEMLPDGIPAGCPDCGAPCVYAETGTHVLGTIADAKRLEEDPALSPGYVEYSCGNSVTFDPPSRQK